MAMHSKKLKGIVLINIEKSHKSLDYFYVIDVLRKAGKRYEL